MRLQRSFFLPPSPHPPSLFLLSDTWVKYRSCSVMFCSRSSMITKMLNNISKLRLKRINLVIIFVKYLSPKSFRARYCPNTTKCGNVKMIKPLAEVLNKVVIFLRPRRTPGRQLRDCYGFKTHHAARGTSQGRGTAGRTCWSDSQWPGFVSLRGVSFPINCIFSSTFPHKIRTPESVVCVFWQIR